MARQAASKSPACPRFTYESFIYRKSAEKRSGMDKCIAFHVRRRKKKTLRSSVELFFPQTHVQSRPGRLLFSRAPFLRPHVFPHININSKFSLVALHGIVYGYLMQNDRPKRPSERATDQRLPHGCGHFRVYTFIRNLPPSPLSE